MVEILINDKPYCPFLEKEPIIVDSWQIKRNGFPIAGCFEVSTSLIEPSILALICTCDMCQERGFYEPFKLIEELENE